MSLATVVSCLAAATGRGAEPALLDFEAGVGAWEFSPGAEFPGAKGSLQGSPQAARTGTAGARLLYDFTGGGAYVAMYLVLPQPLDLQAVEFEVRKPAAAKLTFRATDSAGQTCQKSIEFGHAGWQRVRVRMDTWDFSWGGPADHVLRQPVTRLGILVESRGLPAAESTGAVDIDDLRAIPRAAAAARPTPPPPAVYTVHEFAPGTPLTFDITGEAVAARGLPETSLLGSPQELRLEVARSTAALRVRLDCASHFEHFSREIGTLRASAEPQVLNVAPPPVGWEHSGGEDDGNLHGPVRVLRVAVQALPGQTAKGELVLTRLTCVTTTDPARPVFVVPLHRREGDLDVLDARLLNLRAGPLPAVLAAEFQTEDGEPLPPWQTAVALPPNGQPLTVAVPRPAGAHPCLDIVLQVRATDGTPLSTPVSAGLASPMAETGSATLVPASPWGMGLYLYRYADSAEGLDRMRQAAALAQAAGVKWSREEILWHRTEPERGRFDFHFYDQVVDCAHQHGVSVYGLLTYWSSWTKPYTEEGVEDYCRWVRQVVTHYKARIHHWEIWNEPNIFFWSGPKELYPVLLERAYAVIKEVDPTAQVLGCSTAGIDRAFIQRCLDAQAPFDILTVHPYRGSLDDRGFIAELQDTAKLVGGRPVWITEMGWPTHIGGQTEMEQAQLLSRAYLCAVASGAAPNVSWYDFREDGAEPFYNEHHFGAVRQELQPKAAYRALATVCNTLGTVTAAENLPAPTGFLAYRFQGRDRAPVTVLWSAAESATLALAGLPAKTTLRSFTGRDTVLDTPAGTAYVFVAAGSPVFLLDSPTAAVTGLPVRLLPPQDAVRPGQPARLRLRIENRSATAVAGQAELDLPAGWTADPPRIAVPAGADAEMAIGLHIPAGAADAAGTVTCRLATPSGMLRASTRVELAPEVVER